MTEIAKALAMDARILIMDEPTSTLPDDEVEILFGIIRQLKARGIAVVFVSHRLEETRRIADRVTVLRDGRFVGEAPVADMSDQRDHPHDGRARPSTTCTPRRRTSRPGVGAVGAGPQRARACCSDISFDVRRGEVLGFGGLVGAGRTEIARCIFGADRIDSGTITARRRAGRHPLARRTPSGSASATCPRTASCQGLFLEMSDPRQHRDERRRTG